MDLVKTILNELSGDSLGKLGALVGADAEKTRTAAAAAVPTILSSLAGLAASDEGARKLTSALNTLDSSSPGGFKGLSNLASMLGGDSNALMKSGGNLLSSLMGDSLVSNVATAVGRFGGLDVGSSKKLLSSLMPLILGLIGGSWKSQGGSASALLSLFADQKKNIASALPAGFNLASIPGLPSAESALRVAGQTARAAGDVARRTADTVEDTSQSLFKWLTPLAAVLLLALGLWYFFGRGKAVPELAKGAADKAATAVEDAAKAVTTLRPELPAQPALPDIGSVSKDLTGIFTSATQALGGITDAGSAQAALPKLLELSGKIDGIRGLLDKLPAAGQTALGELVGKQFEPLQEQAAKVLAAPSVGDDVKSTLTGIVSKLAGLNLAQVSQDATSIFTSLTKTLGGFKDPSSAEAAMPQLREVSSKIDDLKRIQASMSPGGQSMLAKLVASSRGPLDQLIAKVLTTLGVEAAAVKPVLDEIVDKLTGLSSPPAQS